MLPFVHSDRILTLAEVEANLKTLSDVEALSDLVPDEYGRNLYCSGVVAWGYRFFYAGSYGKERMHSARQHAIEATFKSAMHWAEHPGEPLYYLRRYGPLVKKWTPSEKLRGTLPQKFWTEFPKIVEKTIQARKKIKRKVTLEEFEEVTSLPIPFEELERLAKDEVICHTIDTKLQPWIRRLNECLHTPKGVWDLVFRDYRTLSFSLFIKTMKYAVGEKHLERLLWRMENRHVEILSMADPEYMERRRIWFEAKRVGEFTLRQSEGVENEKYPILSFDTDQGKILSFPMHAWFYKLEAFTWKRQWVDSREKNNLPPLPLKQITELSRITPEGYTVGEPYTLCYEVDWSKSDELSEGRYQSILAFCKDMIEQRYFPGNAKPEYFAFINEQLVLLTYCRVTYFCLFEIVYLLCAWFYESPAHLKRMIKDLKINETPEHRYLRDVICHYFEKRPYSLDEIPAKCGINDPLLIRSQPWIDRVAARLHQATFEYHQKIVNVLMERYQWSEKKCNLLRQLIKEVILITCDEACNVFYLDERFIPEIAETVVERSRAVGTPKKLSRFQRYLYDKIVIPLGKVHPDREE